MCDIMGATDTIDDPYLQKAMKENIVEVERPEQLHLSYDRSCNLRCPMCRPHAIHVASGPDYEVLRGFQDTLKEGILRVVPNVTITGSGDPFGSKHYFELLKSMDAHDYPDLRLTLLTNGQLVDRTHWDAISGINPRVKEIMVSIDSASEAVYKINRPPGRWDVMLNNLQFISDLRSAGHLDSFVSVFIVQDTNWREMEDYVKLAERFGMDEVRFKPVLNFGHYSDEQLARASVHFKGHPEHEEFTRMLNNSSILAQDWVKKGAGLANLLWRPLL
jgi:MoaA/NifB/PqqE/SkfB family radical SAM enzyme